ncbi:MAG: hypothetical protein RSC93_00480 [Erysipelotrichaceae bacterium]
MNKFSDNDLDILVEIQTAVLEKNFNKMYDSTEYTYKPPSKQYVLMNFELVEKNDVYVIEYYKSAKAYNVYMKHSKHGWYCFVSAVKTKEMVDFLVKQLTADFVDPIYENMKK